MLRLGRQGRIFKIQVLSRLRVLLLLEQLYKFPVSKHHPFLFSRHEPFLFPKHQRFLVAAPASGRFQAPLQSLPLSSLPVTNVQHTPPPPKNRQMQLPNLLHAPLPPTNNMEKHRPTTNQVPSLMFPLLKTGPRMQQGAIPSSRRLLRGRGAIIGERSDPGPAAKSAAAKPSSAANATDTVSATKLKWQKEFSVASRRAATFGEKKGHVCQISWHGCWGRHVHRQLQELQGRQHQRAEHQREHHGCCFAHFSLNAVTTKLVPCRRLPTKRQ